MFHKLSWSLVHANISYTFSKFINVLPEALCCCLQTCHVDVMMDCMCIPSLIVVKVGILFRKVQPLFYNSGYPIPKSVGPILHNNNKVGTYMYVPYFDKVHCP